MNSVADTVDNFQLFIRNKQVLNEAGKGSALKRVNLLIIKKPNLEDSIHLNYHHCTGGTTNRKIKLVDSANTVLYEWSFPDEIDARTMNIPIKELYAKAKMKFLSLYYYDDRIENGRFLTLIAFEGKKLPHVLMTHRNKYKKY